MGQKNLNSCEKQYISLINYHFNLLMIFKIPKKNGNVSSKPSA